MTIAEYYPLQLTLDEIRSAIPSRLFIRDTKRSLLYAIRDFCIALFLFFLALKIDPLTRAISDDFLILKHTLRWTLWALYWWFQGLTFTGIWVIGHECGHNAFSPSKHLCNIMGFILHSALFTPYFSWRISHHRHHSNHASMEKDEVYVPKTRSELGIPKEEEFIGAKSFDYEEHFGDTPIYTLILLISQQLFAFPAYLLYNVSGQKGYPKWTNHFMPSSVIFHKGQRTSVILSNIGILSMIWILRVASLKWGFSTVMKIYGVPWFMVSHWFVMITYLHHTDSQLPHFRKGAWNFQRGAACTVDRDFLGWQGRFFLHDVAHYHVIHHFFPRMPWYNSAEATTYLREILKDHYVHSDAPVFETLWKTYNFCQFVEDEGDIVFYKNKRGEAVRQAAILSPQ